MHFHIPLHERYSFLTESSGDTNFIDAVPITFDLKEIERIEQNAPQLCAVNLQVGQAFI
ncbi:MAG TPA: hypothetical protein VIQ31_39380 [Phormidium sp.]